MYKPLSQEEIQRIKNEKKQKQNEKKQKVTENRKHLASVRVVQRNLVFVVGLSQRLADPEVSTALQFTNYLCHWEVGDSCSCSNKNKMLTHSFFFRNGGSVKICAL